METSSTPLSQLGATVFNGLAKPVVKLKGSCLGAKFIALQTVTRTAGGIGMPGEVWPMRRMVQLRAGRGLPVQFTIGGNLLVMLYDLVFRYA
jgi:hypothetical protein